VTVDLQEPASDLESARIDLDEFSATQDEFTAFFGDVFDQLQCLSLELFARHKCLEVTTGQKSESAETLADLREELQRLTQELQQLHGQLQVEQQETQESWTEIRASYQRFLDDHADLRDVRENFRQIAGEFAEIKADVQRERQDLNELHAKIEGQLAQFSNSTAELSEALAHPVSDSQIAEILEHTRQQQAEWNQQRAALERELDIMRRRAAEQAESLNEQKRLAGQQQAELAGELKRMRSMMETLASQVRGAPAGPGDSSKPPSDDSSVLSSVLAQFEMLQRDIAFRRNKRNNESDSSQK